MTDDALFGLLYALGAGIMVGTSVTATSDPSYGWLLGSGVLLVAVMLNRTE